MSSRRLIHAPFAIGKSALCIGVPTWQATCAAGIMRKPLGKRRRGIAFTTGRPDQKGGPPSSQSPPTISGKALSGNVTEPAVTRLPHFACAKLKRRNVGPPPLPPHVSEA